MRDFVYKIRVFKPQLCCEKGQTLDLHSPKPPLVIHKNIEKKSTFLREHTPQMLLLRIFWYTLDQY